MQNCLCIVFLVYLILYVKLFSLLFNFKRCHYISFTGFYAKGLRPNEYKNNFNLPWGAARLGLYKCSETFKRCTLKVYKKVKTCFSLVQNLPVLMIFSHLGYADTLTFVHSQFVCGDIYFVNYFRFYFIDWKELL